MSGPELVLRQVLRPIEHVLLDFDGPVCSVFAGLPAAEVAARMITDLRVVTEDVPAGWTDERDPLALLRLVADELPEMTARADDLLERAENEAIRVARPTPGAAELLHRCAVSGRSVWIVSNNSGSSIRAYVQAQGFGEYVSGVFGRVPRDPTSLKPNPRLLIDAMTAAAAKPTECVFVGDAARDVEAGRAAGLETIGYANKPGKAEKLTAAGAVVIVEAMQDIADAMR